MYHFILRQIKIMDNKIFFKMHKKPPGQRKDVWEEYDTLKQHIFFSLTHENWQRKVKPRTMSRTLASGIFLRKKSYL